VHTCAYTQDALSLQTIETSSGVTYEGWLIDSFDGTVMLEDIGGDTLVFTDDEITRWTNPFYFVYRNNRFHQKTGPFSILDFGLGGIDEQFTLQFSYIYGRRLTPRISAGMGTGINLSGKLDQLASQEFFGELFLYVKYYLNDKRFRPFLETKAGAFSGIETRIRNDLKPGLLLEGALGIEVALQTETRISIKLNYLFMYAIAKAKTQTIILDDVNIKRSLLGICFNF